MGKISIVNLLKNKLIFPVVDVSLPQRKNCISRIENKHEESVFHTTDLCSCLRVM